MIFPPAFLDSSSCWNTNHNHLQLQQIGSNTHITTAPSPAGPGDGGGNNSNQEGLMATVTAGGGSINGGSGGARDGYGGGGENNKPMSMWERARLARVPQPESGLNCPRCGSTNTKFCYFNNYSLTQPRHLCRACRRYWTRGGALRNVPVGGRSHRHAKRNAKPKVVSAASGAGARTSSTIEMMPSTTAWTTDTAATSPTLQYSMFGSSPPQGRFADSFNPVSLSLSFPARLLFADDGVHHHHHQGNANNMDQWEAAQMQSFPFMHAMDHQMAGPPAAVMPTTMAAIQGMFHQGLQSGGGSNGMNNGGGAYAADSGVHHHHHDGNGNGMEQWAVAQMQNLPFLHAMDHHMGEPLAAAMTTTMAEMQGMFHLVLQSGVNGDDGGDHQFHQQQQDYTSSRGIYGDIVNGNGGGSYNFCSSTSNAAA